jgi:hypothetical protein
MKEKLLFIERNGSAEFRLYLSNVLTALAKMVGSAMAPASATGSDNIAAEHELFLIGEVIRQSRAMDARRGLSYLRYFAQLLPASRPARSALFRAVKASKRQRSVLLDLIQLGGYCCATTL